jgi:hypothetical protein
MGYRNTIREKRRRRDKARKEEAFDRHYPGSRRRMVCGTEIVIEETPDVRPGAVAFSNGFTKLTRLQLSTQFARPGRTR